MTQQESDLEAQNPSAKELALECVPGEEDTLWLQRYLDNALEPAARAECSARLEADAGARAQLAGLNAARHALRTHVEQLAQDTLDGEALFARITAELDAPGRGVGALASSEATLPRVAPSAAEPSRAQPSPAASSSVLSSAAAPRALALENVAQARPRSVRPFRARTPDAEASRQGRLRMLSAKSLGRVIVVAPMLAAAAALMLWVWSGDSATEVLATRGVKQGPSRWEGSSTVESQGATGALASGRVQERIQVLRGVGEVAPSAMDGLSPAAGAGWVSGGSGSPHTEILEVDFGSHGGTIYSGADDSGRATIIWIADS